MRTSTKTISMERPPEYRLYKLYGDFYEFEHNTDIEEQKVKHGDEQEFTQFEYNRFSNATHLQSYDEAVSAFVGLKYSTGDEIALTRKSFTTPTEKEVTDYLAYVEACKVFVRSEWKG